MKNLIRGGVILSLLGLFVVFIYAQTETGTAPEEEYNSNEVILKQVIIKPTVIATPEIIKEKAQDKKEEVAQDKNYKSKVEKTAMVRKAVSKRKFVATAYCLKGKTAMGHKVRNGLIAADPRILRLGTNVNIDAGSYSGTYLVSDTGGMIKGNRIDIWMSSCSEARRFGRRSVLIYPTQ